MSPHYIGRSVVDVSMTFATGVLISYDDDESHPPHDTTYLLWADSHTESQEHLNQLTT